MKEMREAADNDVNNENAEIAEEQAKIAQYKEKFATLRIYVDGGDDYVEGMIKFAEYLTSKTCQHTGEAGDLYKKGGWYATLSPKKAKQLGFSATKEQ